MSSIHYKHLMIPFEYHRRFKNLATNHDLTMTALFRKMVELGEREDMEIEKSKGENVNGNRSSEVF